MAGPIAETFATPDDFGDIRASDLHASRTEALAATAAEALDPRASPSAMYFLRRAREAVAGGEMMPGLNMPDSPLPGDVDVMRQVKASIPDTSIEDAKARRKQEGLEHHLTLPDQPSIKTPVLDLMVQEAQERRDREAAISRGPQGFTQDALGFVTGVGAGMIDPVNAAAFSIPVVGEARFGGMLAAAGESLAGRAAVRAGVGAAQGAVGTAVLQPADWWLHTKDGLDYTMTDALRSVITGAGMGAAFHAGFGAVGDVRARWRGVPLPGSPEDQLARALTTPGEPAGEPGAAALPGEGQPELPNAGAPGEEIPGIAPSRFETTVTVNGETRTLKGEYNPADIAAAGRGDGPPRVQVQEMPSGEAERTYGSHLFGDEQDVSAPPEGSTQSHLIIRSIDGAPLAVASVTRAGSTANIDSINAIEEIKSGGITTLTAAVQEPQNQLGPAAVRDVLRQYLKAHPEVTTITGNRISGARFGGQSAPLDRGKQISVDVAAARQITQPIFESLRDQMIAAGRPEDEANQVAAVTAARYTTRAQRLGRPDAEALAREAGIEIRPGGELAEEGRAYAQNPDRGRWKGAELTEDAQWETVARSVRDRPDLDEQFRNVLHNVSNGSTFKDAIEYDGSPELARLFGGDLSSNASNVSFADRLPEGGETERDQEHYSEHQNHEAFVYDVAFTDDGRAVVSNIRGGEEEHLQPASELLNKMQFRRLQKEIADSVQGHLEDRAEEAAETKRWEALTPQQQAAELAGQERAQAERDGALTKRINAAVDAALARGWRPEFNQHGGWKRPPELEEFASPASLAKIKARLAERLPETQFFQRASAPTFYSAVERAVTGAKQEKASPQQWLGMLRNAAGVKPEEMEWLGLANWLKDQKGQVTKQAIADYVRANQIEVKEITKGATTEAQVEELHRRAAEADRAFQQTQHGTPEADAALERYNEAADAETALHDQLRREGTKFGQYTLPGGENYRELLLTLPTKERTPGYENIGGSLIGY